ncbi:Alpha/Beta hydrolase protein [Syncephalis pseudoplumigaleata]|uniref:Alpha/Beta hydrolase protein n=1 Tax=Syncephalis pseudoplumigaleata TaxID=1712513 RepID=A0A4P9Z2H9_9FUNG|nr:Alpha/Beta hydrolase protein [Syncephalis pseudoplumigaleata]|eukprot:RKP25670.1 Alpha/Beta hydrolase protein [Syncephalis pseudoplumigaleata]
MAHQRHQLSPSDAPAATTATEAWLVERIHQNMPTTAQTPEMCDYAAGVASLQMATFQQPPSPTNSTPHSASASWIHRLLAIMLQPFRWPSSPPPPSSLSLDDQHDSDYVLVQPEADLALACAGWQWPWTHSSPPSSSTLPPSWCAVPADEIAHGRRYARYASAAYCLSDSVLAAWSCPPHCQAVPGITRVARVFSAVSTGTRDYIATIAPADTAPPDELIVAFRGTLNLRGLAHDLYFAHASQEIPQEFKSYFATLLLQQSLAPDLEETPCVHAGFYRSLQSVSDEVLAVLEEQCARHPSLNRLTICGHSLGGALAILMALLLLVRRPAWLARMSRIGVYTYGEPRVGNAAFARLVQLALVQSKLTVIRVTNEGDPVPALPPNQLEFAHHPRRWLIAGQDGGTYCMGRDANDGPPADAAIGEEGPNLGRWWPLSDPMAHLRAWDIIFGPWCHGGPA